MYKAVKEQQQAYELMKKVFADLDITYEENVPDDQIGFYAVKDGVEKRLPDDFLKGFNIETTNEDVNGTFTSTFSELLKDYTDLLVEDNLINNENVTMLSDVKTQNFVVAPISAKDFVVAPISATDFVVATLSSDVFYDFDTVSAGLTAA